MFRRILLASCTAIGAIGAQAFSIQAVSARATVSVGSLTEVVNRDGIGDHLIGYGVVSGLQGTGDDFSKSPTLARSYLTLLENLQIPGLTELALSRTESFAVVLVAAEVPFTAGLGDRLDVSISSAFDAESLEGGRLEYAILRPPVVDGLDVPLYATVVGAAIPATLPNALRTTLLGAGRIEKITPLTQQDIFMRDSVDGAVGFELRLLAPWSSSGVAAREIADAINEELAFDQDMLSLASLRENGRIFVRFPEVVSDVNDRIRFLSNVDQIRIDDGLVSSNGSTVFLDRARGVIVVGANVRFLPTAVSVEGLEHITIQPALEPTMFDPLIQSNSAVGLATGGAGGPRLQELVEQMRMLQVPVNKQMDVIIALRASGALLNVDLWKMAE